MSDLCDIIARQIDELEKKLQSVFRHERHELILPSQWIYAGGILSWHVGLIEEVLEPDLDIEITSVAIIVRARSARDHSKILLGVLPVPEQFDYCNPDICFKLDSLEIRLSRIENNSD